MSEQSEHEDIELKPDQGNTSGKPGNTKQASGTCEEEEDEECDNDHAGELEDHKTSRADKKKNKKEKKDKVAELEDRLTEMGEQLKESQDKFLRLYSEFDNYRKRTNLEKIELRKTASEELLRALLPVLDDFERGHKSMADAKDIAALKEGLNLVHNKLRKTLEQNGLKPMQAVGEIFDTELHEALSQIAAPSDDMKGKVYDEIEKGYYLNEKVIRFAKVIVAN